MRKCERCGAETSTTTGSMFNTEMICMACKRTERDHPLYPAARDAEHNAVKSGDYNFPGIGLPDDLKTIGGYHGQNTN